MDEEKNNNSAKQVADTGKKIAKEALKEGTKEVRKKIVTAVLPYVGWAVLILLAVGAINLIVYEIRSFFSGKAASANADDVASTASSQMQSLVTFGDNGEYKLDENYADDLIAELEAKSINPKEMGYITSSGENMIQKYIEVELQTMLPKTNLASGDFDGLVTIQRVKPNGTIVKMKYEKYETFKNNPSEDKFSIDPKTFKLLLLGGSTTTIFTDLNGSIVTGITEEGDRSAKIEEIDYQALIQSYAVPFNFLITLHAFAQDVNFMNDVVDMILESDEPVVLSYIESASIATTIKEYSGNEKVYERKNVTDSEGKKTYGHDTLKETNPVNNQNVKAFNDRYADLDIDLTWAKKVTTSKYGVLNVTKADTWLKKTEKEIENRTSPETQIGEPVQNDYFGDYLETEPKDNEPEGGKTEIITSYIINIYEDIIGTGYNQGHTLVDKESEIKVDDFVALIKKYPGVKNNFETAPSNIFDMLQESENTQKWEKIMRYVIYKLSGISYGVSESDLELIFADEDYTYASSDELLVQNIRYWEYFNAPPTNADGTKYIIYTDTSGETVVGYGVSIEKYKELFESEGYSTEIGAEVDVEFVDDLEINEIQERKAEIENVVQGLELSMAQVNALVLRSYDFEDYMDAVNSFYGSMNFVKACETYWDEERDGRTKEQTTEADFTHKLYVQYMSKPLTEGEGQDSTLLERRRQSEWTLFQTGYYDALYKWDPSSRDIMVVAERIHKFMEDNFYTYCVNDASQGDECAKFGKSHGLRNTFEQSVEEGKYLTCCATFVSWVLQETGHMDVCQHGASSCATELENNGWKKVSLEDMEPGDVVVYDGHVEIYAGDGTVYNAGGGDSIRRASPYGKKSYIMSNANYGLRAP